MPLEVVCRKFRPTTSLFLISIYSNQLITLGEQAVFSTGLFPNHDKMHLTCSPPLHSVDYFKKFSFYILKRLISLRSNDYFLRKSCIYQIFFVPLRGI